MTDENQNTDVTPTQPVYPPIDATKNVPPVTPFAAWTWTTPVIPQFYWNVYSAEQRVRQICTEIGKIQAYLSYFASNSNAAHWYLDQRFTEVETRLTQRVDKLEADLKTEVTRLDKLIAEETKARQDGDTALGNRIDDTNTKLDNEISRATAAELKIAGDLDTETTNREKADEALGNRIDAEATTREQDDTKLGNRITDETTDRENADTALGNRVDAVDARVTQEVTDRTQADTRLENKIDANTANITANADAISKETERAKAAEAANTSLINANKTAADEADKRIQDSLDTEIANRKNSDNTLTESIANETKSRQDADKDITSRLDGEAKTRADADTALTKSVNQRVIPTNVKAAEGSHLTVTTTVSEDDPNGTTVTLSDTFDADFTALDTKVTDLEGKLTHETNDRETADNTLTEAVNKRLTAEKVLAGDNITVTPDPDATTVTIAAKVPDVSQKLESVEVKDFTLVGNGTSDNPLGVNLANSTDQSDANVAYVRPTATTHYLGIKAGDGLTAYNVDSDPDQGSGIRLSDHVNELLEDSEKALKTVATGPGVIGDGSSENPVQASIHDHDESARVGAYIDYTNATEWLFTPIATSSNVGVVKPDGTTTTVDADGTIHAVASGTSGIDKVTTDNTLTGFGTSSDPLKLNYFFKESYGEPSVQLYHDKAGHPVLPIAGTATGNGGNQGIVKILKSVEDKSKASDIIRSFDDTGALRVLNATNDTAGAVKPDGTTTTVDSDGTIHAVTSGLGNVTVDDTLTGDGTSAHPLGVSETIVANSTAGSTALQIVHHDDTLTGTGTDSDTLKVEHAIRIHQIEYMLESSESVKDITGGYYNGWKSGVFKANGRTGLEDGTEIAIGILPIMVNDGEIINNQYPQEAGQPFNITYDATSVIVPMQKVPGDPKFTATVISIKIK